MRAERYDELRSATNRDLLEWTARCLPLANRCIEVGCGTGRLTAHLTPFCRSIDACDISERMVFACRVRCKGFENVVVHHRSYEEMQGRWDLVVARLVLRHFPHPVRDVRNWVHMLDQPGAVAIAEGPPPAWGSTEKLYETAMAIKHGSHRLTLHSHRIAQWLLDAGATEVTQVERWTHDNSLRNWAEAGGATPEVVQSLLTLHRNASGQAHEAYQMRDVGDDILMRWRHCVVVGRFA